MIVEFISASDVCRVAHSGRNWVQKFAGAVVLILQHFLGSTVEALDVFYGLRKQRCRQAVCDAEVSAKLFKLLFSRRDMFAPSNWPEWLTDQWPECRRCGRDQKGLQPARSEGGCGSLVSRRRSAPPAPLGDCLDGRSKGQAFQT